jgi:hypothetical protein
MEGIEFTIIAVGQLHAPFANEEMTERKAECIINVCIVRILSLEIRDFCNSHPTSIEFTKRTKLRLDD